MLIIFSSNVSADTNTFSDKLNKTDYMWKVTTSSGPDAEDLAIKGDYFKYTFSEAPGGKTVDEYLELSISISVNGDSLDLGKNITEFTGFELFSVVFILEWAYPSPENTLTEGNGFTIDNGKAITNDGYYKMTYDLTSGILEKMESSDDSNTFILEYQDSILNTLPMNTLYLLIGIFAIPVIKRFKR